MSNGLRLAGTRFTLGDACKDRRHADIRLLVILGACSQLQRVVSRMAAECTLKILNGHRASAGAQPFGRSRAPGSRMQVGG